jgi:hypothetical protein
VRVDEAARERAHLDADVGHRDDFPQIAARHRADRENMIGGAAARIDDMAVAVDVEPEAQRPALPAPARTLVDGIGVQLDLLAPQLQTLDPGELAAANIRKLVGEDLPELVAGYQRIPAGLRGEAHAGRTPDETLVGGLKMLEREIGEAARNLAAGELDKLATRERYLQLKYEGLEAEDITGKPA